MSFILFAIVLSVPFDYIWNALAPIYFSALPEMYLHIPLWHCMGLFVLCATLRVILFLTPVVFMRGKNLHP